MKKIVFITLALVFAVSLYGCGRKQEALEDMQQPVSIETLNAIPSVPVTPEPQAVSTQAAPAVQAGLEPIPQVTAAKPTSIEIQTALKNAGFYSGDIDGKIGPRSKKAIEEFQKANGLKSDGKVGPKTWSILRPYLNPVPEKKKR